MRLINAAFIFLAIAMTAFTLFILYSANFSDVNFLLDLLPNFPGIDKAGHFVLFGLFAFFLNSGLNFKYLFVKGLPIYWGALIVALISLIDEFIQAFFPNRTVDALDLPG